MHSRTHIRQKKTVQIIKVSARSVAHQPSHRRAAIPPLVDCFVDDMLLLETGPCSNQAPPPISNVVYQRAIDVLLHHAPDRPCSPPHSGPTDKTGCSGKQIRVLLQIHSVMLLLKISEIGEHLCKVITRVTFVLRHSVFY